jgi:phospholipid/cholesterol/gamma-HCH transport system permease protein
LISNILFSFGRYVLLVKGMLAVPDQPKMFWNELMQEAAEMGWRSIGIVSIISVFIGGVTTVQTAYQLVSPIIPKAAIAQIVREAVLLEFSPTLICIVLAGVLGSKMTSEIGNMRISEQIDALEVIGVNSKNWLIMPKVIASLLIIPMLTMISASLAILGGRIAGEMTGIIPGEIYDVGLLMGFKSFTVLFMLVKAYCFAFLLSSVACFFGYYCEGGAIEIGRATTKSVMVNSVLILLMDYLLSMLLLSR